MKIAVIAAALALASPLAAFAATPSTAAPTAKPAITAKAPVHKALVHKVALKRHHAVKSVKKVPVKATTAKVAPKTTTKG